MPSAILNAALGDAALRVPLPPLRGQAARQRKGDATPCFLCAAPGGEASSESGGKGYGQFRAPVAKAAGS